MITNTYTVKAHEVRKGDVVNGHTVKANKTGTKWTELRDADGKLIIRCDQWTDVTVDRLEKTEEELYAERLDWAITSLTKTLKDQLAYDPMASLVESATNAQKKGWVELVDHYKMEVFLKAQAKRKVFLEINGVLGSDLKDGRKADVLDAFILVLTRGRQARARFSYPSDPMSRSTSIMSNLYDDLDRWAYESVAYDVKYDLYGVYDRRLAELDAMMEA